MWITFVLALELEKPAAVPTGSPEVKNEDIGGYLYIIISYLIQKDYTFS